MPTAYIEALRRPPDPTDAEWISFEDMYIRHRPRKPKRWTKRSRARYAMKMSKFLSDKNLTKKGREFWGEFFRSMSSGVIGEWKSCVIIESDWPGEDSSN